MERRKKGLLGIQMGSSYHSDELLYHPGGLFASVGQVGVGLGMSADPPSSKEKALRIPYTDLYVKYQPSEAQAAGQRARRRLAFRLRVENPSLRRLISGAVAGAVSRTTVAPLETIRTHLMVGTSGGNSMAEVFHNIMANEGWTGLFRGNLVNVLRVAPSRAIELFAFETGKKLLTPLPGEPPKTPLPPSLVAGAVAGVCSTLCTYPLELLKTRLTIERGVYRNLLHALVKIVREEGAGELYRGLLPSVVGVIPYAATNYYAYDALRKAYRRMSGREEVGNVATLLIGSAAGAIASSATFPLEVARKHVQVGAVGGRQVYRGMLHALLCIMQQEGVPGLYRGLGPSCIKLVPAAGISFMCYEACKKVLTDRPPDEESL